MGVSREVAGLRIVSLIDGFADFEKTFIQCIVYNYEVLKEYKDEASLKAAGKVMTKGKDYGAYPTRLVRFHMTCARHTDSKR